MTTRTKSLPLLFLVTALLGACSTMPASTESSASPSARASAHASHHSSPNLSAGTPYFLPSFAEQDIRRDAMKRYMCEDGQPLQCRCMSKLAPTCRCSCTSFELNPALR
jgi:hypothetical protein